MLEQTRMDDQQYRRKAIETTRKPLFTCLFWCDYLNMIPSNRFRREQQQSFSPREYIFRLIVWFALDLFSCILFFHKQRLIDEYISK